MSIAPQSGWFHNNFERYHDWQVVNDKSVNAVQASDTAFSYAADGSSMTQFTVGPAWAGWLAKKSLRLGVWLSSGTLTASVDIWPSLEAVGAQAWEFDDRLVDPAGNVYACDCNFNLAEGGVVQSVKANGAGWDDTEFATGIPPAGQWITLSRTYSFSPAGCQMVAASLGAKSSKITKAVLVPPLPLGWAPLAIIKQNQVDENAAGQTYGLTTRNNHVSAIGNL